MQWTGRSGGRRGSGVRLPALLLTLCVFLCLVAAAVLGAASASASPRHYGVGGSALASAAGNGRALGTPRVLAPKGVTTPLQPTLKWTKVKRARSYDLRIYQGGELLRFFNGWRGTSRRVAAALPADVTLTFKVRARNARRIGAWSKGIKFVISSPTPESPSGMGTTSTFKWGALRGAATYDLSVSGNGVGLSQSGLTALSHTFAQDLPTNIPLTWRVRGDSAQGRGAWSTPRPFTFVGGSPAVQATPIFSPDAGAVAWPTDVTITSAGADAIYYTTDGSTPTRSSTLYAGPVTVNSARTLKALAVKAGHDDSAVGSAAYTQAASANLSGLALSGSPTNYSFAAGTYSYSGVSVLNGVASVTVTPTGSGVITVQSTAVTSGSASDPIALTAGTPKTITVVGTQAGKSAKTYTIEVTRQSVQATPTFGPVAGAVAWGTGVTISSSGADAIYYTTDGSTPTRGSTNQATTPLVINAAETVKALAVKAGHDDSAVGSAAYTQAASANLSGLALSGSPSNYSFAAGTYAYTGVTVAKAVPGVTVTPSGSGTITVEGVAVASGSASDSIALTAGTPKTITVVATQAGRSAKTYAITVTRQALAAGDAYQGGIVAYILQEGDPGYVAGQTKGLIAAAADQGKIVWALPGFTSTLVPDTYTAIGTGSANTDKIISQNGSGSTYAAGLARAYNGGGFTDWYLPSLDELLRLYANRVAIDGFSSEWYWSSSDSGYDSSQAQVEVFSSGNPGWEYKSHEWNVRPVRSFSGVSSKAITAFSFEGLTLAAPGIVNEGGHSISVAVPYGTDVSALVATFTTTGASVKVGGTKQKRGVTANDFTSPVTYTVTAADASTQNYTVTVTENSSLVIGQGYGGGVVAYLDDPDAPADEQSGLIAATVDQDGGSGIQWAVVVSDVLGASGTAIGTGTTNTDAIILQNGPYDAGTNAYAAGLARAYNGGSYHDWYLPSRDELNKLYISQDLIGNFSSSAVYWTSSWFEYDTGFAWSQAFDVFAHQGGSYESEALRVRAVRSFTVDPGHGE